MSDGIELQNREFEAADRFAEALRNCLGTPVVDDDYPEMRYYYESALAELLESVRANKGNRFDHVFGITKHLTFKQLREISLKRCARWHPLHSWSLSDWMTATTGELGEAANIIKKLNRVRDKMIGNKESPDELRSNLGKELADVAIYLDLLSAAAGVDLENEIRSKFNEVSERNGFPERL